MYIRNYRSNAKPKLSYFLEPLPVTSLTVRVDSTTTATVSWQVDDQSIQDGFQMTYNPRRPWSDESPTVINLVSTARSEELTNLDSGKEYEYFIVAMSSGRQSDQTNETAVQR